MLIPKHAKICSKLKVANVLSLWHFKCLSFQDRPQVKQLMSKCGLLICLFVYLFCVFVFEVYVCVCWCVICFLFGGLRLLFVYVIIVLLFVYCCCLLLLLFFLAFFSFFFVWGGWGVVVMVAGWRVYQSNAVFASFRHVCTGRERYPGLLRLDEFVERYVN